MKSLISHMISKYLNSPVIIATTIVVSSRHHEIFSHNLHRIFAQKLEIGEEKYLGISRKNLEFLFAQAFPKFFLQRHRFLFVACCFSEPQPPRTKFSRIQGWAVSYLSSRFYVAARRLLASYKKGL